MSQRPLTAVILAAGLGTRMRSRLPKVLHRLGGAPMIDLVLDAVVSAGVERPIVVVNPAHLEVRDHVAGGAEVVFQADPRGTGHALLAVPAEHLRGRDVLVLNGDLPLLTPATVRALLAAPAGSTVVASVPAGGRSDGRIVRRDGRFDRIVEWKDATPEERAIDEVNAGLYRFDGDRLLAALGGLRDDNAAGELYLTDAVAACLPVEIVPIDEVDGLGVNDRHQLVVAEHNLTHRKHLALFEAGVTLRDLHSVFVDWYVEIGEDTVIEPFTILRGRTRIGTGCQIGPYSHLTDSVVGDGCRVEHSRLDRCSIGDGTDCGPFVQVRPGTELGDRVHVGSFAEINRTRVGEGSKVPHFSYLGDAVIGRDVNIAAGTVTANYDGQRKHPTVIEDGVFIGVGTMLRAPIKLGRRSRTGAGSVVLDDVPPEQTVAGVPARPIRRKQ